MSPSCVRCERPMVPGRTAARPGVRRHAGRGLCRTCYTITRRVRLRGTYPLVGAPMLSADVDEVAVERVCNGERSIRLNGPERREAVALLTRRGWSICAIADQLGLADRSVSRLRAQLSEVAA